MTYEIIVERGKQDARSTYQHFQIEADPDATVVWVLEQLNHREELTTIDGTHVEKIHWECGCRQKMCGSCAMLINHRPMLACSAFLRDLGNSITLEPFHKFPRVEDLVVDKSVLHENMMHMRLWLTDEENNPKAARYLKEKVSQELYRSASCLECGCCLEACPADIPLALHISRLNELAWRSIK